MEVLDAKFSSGIMLLNCSVSSLTAAWNNANRSAPFWRLYWNAGPGISVTFKRIKTSLLPSLFTLIPPNTPFAGRCRRRVDQVWIHFAARAPYDVVTPGIYTMRARGDMLRAVRRLPHLCRDASDYARRQRVLIALGLIYLALRFLPESALNPVPVDARIRRVLEAMDHYREHPLSNAELARQIGMNTNAFIRMFRKLTGVTPRSFYMRKRIEWACLQLHCSDMKIEDIAVRAGFYDRFHFSRIFQKIQGMSPVAFRRHILGHSLITH